MEDIHRETQSAKQTALASATPIEVQPEKQPEKEEEEALPTQQDVEYAKYIDSTIDKVRLNLAQTERVQSRYLSDAERVFDVDRKIAIIEDVDEDEGGAHTEINNSSYAASDVGSDDSAPSLTITTEHEAHEALHLLPYRLLRQAERCLKPGVLWEALPFLHRFHAVQAYLSEDITIEKAPYKPLGINITAPNIIRSVTIGSAAQSAGIGRFRGCKIMCVNGEAFEERLLGVHAAVVTLSILGHGMIKKAMLQRIDEPCPSCGNELLLPSDEYCTQCGVKIGTTPIEKIPVVTAVPQRKPLLRAAEAIHGSTMWEQPPMLRGTFSGMDVARIGVMQDTALFEEVQRNVVGDYIKAIQSEQAPVSPRSSTSNNKAARLGKAERRLWGKRCKLLPHPYHSRLMDAGKRQNNAEKEIARLNTAISTIKSGQYAADLERYRLHLRVERNVLKRWLCGVTRGQGATGDPRDKLAKNREMVSQWIPRLEAPERDDVLVVQAEEEGTVPPADPPPPADLPQSVSIRPSTSSQRQDTRPPPPLSVSIVPGSMRSSSRYDSYGSFTTATGTILARSEVRRR